MDPNSLGDQVSKKMSTLILIFVVTILLAAIFVSFIQSLQIYNKQVNSWIDVIPQQAITSLIDSDDFSIKREVAFIKSTGLFSSFGITDNQKRVIDAFGSEQILRAKLVPIQDETKVTWGYYYIKKNLTMLILPFVYSGLIFLGIILGLYLLVRRRMELNLKSEFSQFNQFLNEIESLTEKIQHVYDEKIELVRPSYSHEQVIINRAISRLIAEIKKANQSLREAISTREQKRFEDELTQTALQVAHDIGSPLAVLETIVQDTTLELPEESRIAVRHAAVRMRDITHSLLKKAKHDLLSLQQETLSPHSLYSLINQIVSEKRLQYRSNKNINIHFVCNESTYGLFAMVRVTEFNRMLSNIINNAVESIDSTIGNIFITLNRHDKYAVIQVRDNGKGIPSDMIAKLGSLGVTQGKESGLGLGLYHAKTTVENWAGKLEICSELGKGTEVKIYLPQAKPPLWFLPHLLLSKEQTVVIIDDDESIHAVWRERFKALQCDQNRSLKLIHFYSPQELISQQAVFNNLNILYLCDYEFKGCTDTGINLITKLRITYVSILVTSRFYSDEVIMQCESTGIKLLPKDMANIVPIIFH